MADLASEFDKTRMTVLDFVFSDTGWPFTLSASIYRPRLVTCSRPKSVFPEDRRSSSTTLNVCFLRRHGSCTDLRVSAFACDLPQDASTTSRDVLPWTYLRVREEFWYEDVPYGVVGRFVVNSTWKENQDAILLICRYE